MYTISESTRIVIALLKSHKIKHVVINPGATNIPIAWGVQNDPFFTCYSVVDERSALYFAIGLYLENATPVAITCTSAQATRNFIPGLTEAFYKHVPILAITTSKLERYTGQEYMQAPDQISLPVDSVKKTYDLPYVSTHIDRLHCIRLVNEAILELTHRAFGPVQLNLRMNDSESGKFPFNELPNVRVINRYMSWEKWDVSLTSKKIMLVIGEHRPFSFEQIEIIEKFLEMHNAFVYVNHLSNYHGKYAVSANLLLTGMDNLTFKKTYKPDILITIGGQTGDYPLFGKLSSGAESDFEHWRVAEDGKVVDTYDKLTKVFECTIEQFFMYFKAQPAIQHSYFSLWNELMQALVIPEDLPFSNLYLAQQLHYSIPKDSYLNFAILNSLRSWSFYSLDPSIVCYSNVAAFGIDGCLSVLLGQSVSTDKLCFIVIGDLSFFYDMNSLGIRHLKNNIRILLVNNHCGAEFKLYSHPAYQFGKDADAYIAASGHNSSAKGWAEANGFKYLTANNKEEFLRDKEEFLSVSEQSIIFEVFTRHEDESDALNLITESNKIKSVVGCIKGKMESILGKKTTSELIKMLKK